MDRPVIAVCGKGGVGKTVVTALVTRSLLELDVCPVLLVDADPMMGLTSALGREPTVTLGQIRDHFLFFIDCGQPIEYQLADA